MLATGFWKIREIAAATSGRNGFLRNGIRRNGILQNGIRQNWIRRNEILRNGILRNGILRNGIRRNGFLRNGIRRNGRTPKSDVTARQHCPVKRVNAFKRKLYHHLRNVRGYFQALAFFPADGHLCMVTYCWKPGWILVNLVYGRSQC